MNKIELNKLIAAVKKDKVINENYKSVMTKYHPIFQYDAIDESTIEYFNQFLNFKENMHWTGLQRKRPALNENTDQLLKVIKHLLDEGISIHDRLNHITDKKSEYYYKGINKGILTPILLVSNPQKYGILNDVSYKALKMMGFVNQLPKKIGDRYLTINNILFQLKSTWKIPFWHLDWILWYVANNETINDEDLIDKISRDKMIENLKNLKETDSAIITTNGKCFLRDAKTISQIKFLRDYKCQICGTRILKKNGQYYIEAAHIKEKSKGGSELPNNILVLCPNHHAEFDHGQREIIRHDNERIIFILNGTRYDIPLALK